MSCRSNGMMHVCCSTSTSLILISFLVRTVLYCKFGDGGKILSIFFIYRNIRFRFNPATKGMTKKLLISSNHTLIYTSHSHNRPTFIQFNFNKQVFRTYVRTSSGFLKHLKKKLQYSFTTKIKIEQQ